VKSQVKMSVSQFKVIARTAWTRKKQDPIYKMPGVVEFNTINASFCSDMKFFPRKPQANCSFFLDAIFPYLWNKD
jgi:hypothetical protein